MTTYTTAYDQAEHVHDVKVANAASPFRWVRDGWKDLTAAPVLSTAFGAIFTAACALAYAAATAVPLFSATFLTLLLAISPFIAAMAYYAARQHEHKEHPTMRACFTEVQSRASNIGLFSLLCGLVVAAWVRLASITFALYYGTLGASAAEAARVWTTGGDAPAMLVFLTLSSLVLALTLFTIGAISLPMIADRNCNVAEAVQTSLHTLRKNTTTVLVWMLLLVVFIGIGLLSGLVLMPLVFPLLAYATWHSYRQLSAS